MRRPSPSPEQRAALESALSERSTLLQRLRTLAFKELAQRFGYSRQTIARWARQK